MGRLSLGFDGPRSFLDAKAEARDAAWAALWYLLGYGIPFAVLLASPRPAYELILALPVALAAVLALVIWRTQARWASVVLLVWTLGECVLTSLPLLHGQLNFALVINLCWAVTAARSVRGAFVLARLRRDNASKAAAVQAFS